MAVSFRVVGAWAELTADGAVVIPSTPQTGDRMYLYARWKDFSITATVANWTAAPGTPFADGSVTSGNGTGSVKVGCWYRDWQSGDTNPTIDFSANPTNASVVIIVMAKEASDVWLTPVAVTAAMTNWTTSSQIVAASSTATVLGGGVVMGLIGIRDDTATMTRPSSGIDDSSGAVTWNGNYVEAPATHHSTTTGDDGAADLGYRLVSAGATATLRMTGTISAAETGTALWVVQGVQVNLTVHDSTHSHNSESLDLTQEHVLAVQNADHAHAAANLSITQTHEIAVQNSSHGHTGESPALTQVYFLAVQDANHGHVAETPAVTQTHFLAVQDSVHGHTSENVLVETIHHLDVQNSSHNHVSESVTLTQEHNLAVDNAVHSHTAASPAVRTISIIYLDPGGDAVQVTGYFNTVVANGAQITFDNTQQVAGVGSWKFDSGVGNVAPIAGVTGVLGAERRPSVWFRYDDVPDTAAITDSFAESPTELDYSGGGFAFEENLAGDDGLYATATPARNSGQGTAFGLFGFDGTIPDGAIIDWVKFFYERVYDVDTSEGVSRVKWRINGEEGPNHDNTDMPLTDTVVEVDVTGDRGWEPKDLLDGVFEVIAEARRGDTDTAHTQSWDFLKVQIGYHEPVAIWSARDASNNEMFQIALFQRGAGVSLRFTSTLSGQPANSFDGITELAPNEWHRISLPFVEHGADDLDIRIFANFIYELDISGAATGGFTGAANMRYGWLNPPGANRSIWFTQFYIDDGADLEDPVFGPERRAPLSTAKLPAAVNNNAFDTTGGTGAVNERPVNLDNYRQQAATAQVAQDYTIQAADEGDVDISTETLIGHMYWVIAKKNNTPGGSFQLVGNGTGIPFVPTSTVRLHWATVVSSAYPDDVAGIGLISSTGSQDAFLYECGIVPAYQGPPDPSVLPFQLLAEGSITNLTDDLRADPPDSYYLRWRILESDAQVIIEVYSITFEGQEPQLRRVEQAGPGTSLIPIDNPGIEVSYVIRVTNASVFMSLHRLLNVT